MQYGCRDTALYMASIHGHIDIVNLLISSGCNINVVEEYGVTALHAASLNGHLDVVRVLIRQGCKLNVMTNVSINVVTFT